MPNKNLESISPINNKAGFMRSKTITSEKQIKAKKVLQDALNQSIAQIVEHLKAAGATGEELRAARPGLISAQPTLGPVRAALDLIGITILTLVPVAYVALAYIPEFVQRGGFLLYPLFWMSDWSQSLAEATFYVFSLGAMLGLLLLSIYHNPLTRRRVVLGATLAQQAALQSKRFFIIGRAENWMFFPSFVGAMFFIVIMWLRSMEALSLGKGSTWWDGTLVVLSLFGP